MNLRRLWLTAAVVGIGSLAAANVQAQCATGVNTGGGNCVPPDAPGMPGYDPSPVPQQAEPVWADSWGAIVLDVRGSAKGTSNNMQSKAAAIEAAMSECKSTGASNCELKITYYNQCAAVAWGDESLGIAHEATEKGAVDSAVSSCSERGSGCKPVYTACSVARRVN
ncbi:protein of unknown function [Luteibacter sp. UNCMF331Sha3.1]|nr:protein of unknown function [Luteibacter sp. UNCMF331Sha3.1]